jgi:hypothetical protein
MSWAMLVAAITGLISIYGGTRYGIRWLVEGAGLFTLLASTICAFMLSRAGETDKGKQLESQAEG